MHLRNTTCSSPTTGVFGPRRSSHPLVRELPDARAVSLIIKSHSRVDPEEREERASPINSLFMMQVGQFLDHDVTHTPAQSGK